MSHIVKCINCGQQFDRDKVPFIQVTARRYAHKACPENNNLIIKNKTQETIDKDNFFQLVKSIYGSNYNYIMINSQAENYIKQYGYTWSGMTACLHWFYNINHGSLEEGHGGVGIIPYIYDEVKKYYINIYNTQEKNNKIKLQQPILEFNIHLPQKYTLSSKLLNIDDE